MADLMAALFFAEMLDPKDPKNQSDRFVLSKGTPRRSYAAWAEAGAFDALS
jgi:transketolase N-terminal domain/subunit